MNHHIEDDDQQNFPGQARCACGWRVNGDRNGRLASAHRHLADLFDPPAPPPTIVAFGHLAGVGKDAAADVLVSRFGFRKLSFAEPVRAITYEVDPVVRRHVEAEGWDAAKRTHAHVRTALEDVGAALRRHLWAEVLVSRLLAQAGEFGRVVIPDLRYRNEAAAVLSLGGRVVRVDRPGVTGPTGPSDRDLAGFAGWSATIDNDGTLDDLTKKVCDLTAA